jgi:hypothetical protein
MKISINGLKCSSCSVCHSLVPCRIIPTGVHLNESPMEQAAGINPLLLFIADVGFGLQHRRDGACADSSHVGLDAILLLARCHAPTDRSPDLRTLRSSAPSVERALWVSVPTHKPKCAEQHYHAIQRLIVGLQRCRCRGVEPGYERWTQRTYRDGRRCRRASW